MSYDSMAYTSPQNVGTIRMHHYFSPSHEKETVNLKFVSYKTSMKFVLKDCHFRYVVKFRNIFAQARYSEFLNLYFRIYVGHSY